MTFAPPEPDEHHGVFVSPGGVASNPGTRAAPLASIAEATRLAAAEGKVVFVAAGTYREQVRTRVSMFGGYSPDFSELDPERHRTEIVASGDAHSTVALTIEGGPFAVHGFTLRGGESTHACAVDLRSAVRPTLVRNVICGGGCGTRRDALTFSHGIRARGDDPSACTLLENTIDGGENQHCVAIDGCSTGCVLERNTIVGGVMGATQPSITDAIRGRGGFTLAENCIDAGVGNAWARGLSMTGDRAVVTGNRFTTPKGAWTDCIVPWFGREHVIRGNTLDGIADAECFAWSTKLGRRTWRFHETEGESWAWQAVELIPFGWLELTRDSAEHQEQSSGTDPQYGPSITFGELLRRGPPPSENVPAALVDEIRALLLEAGCTLAALDALDARARRDALLRAVLAEPDRDEPRFRYAQHLEAEGDELGEYIRLATEIQHPKSGYVAARSKRFGELQHLEARVAAPLAPWVKDSILSRGLVALVEMDARTFLEAGHEVFARAPVQHLDLVDSKPVFAELVRCPLLARVRTLRIAYGDLEDEQATLLAASPYVRKLEYLSLCNNRIGEAGLEAIAAAPNLSALRVLSFMNNLADDPVTREGTDITGEPYWEPAGPIQAVLAAKYGRKAWMHHDHTSPSRFDIGRPRE